MRALFFRLGMLVLSAGPVRAGNQALTAGLYGGTLGAGGACAAERLAFGQNPAAIDPRGAGLQLHFHRPFGVEDVGVSEAAAYWDLARLGTALAWRQTEVASLFYEQGFEYQESWRFSSAPLGPVDVGAAWTFWRMAFPGFAEHAFSQGFGFTWAPLARLKAGAFVTGLPAGLASAQVDRVYQWGLQASARPDAWSAESQTVRLDFRKTGAAPWRVIASLSLSPHRALQVSAGLSTSPFQIALGVKLRWGGFAADEAYRYHRYLGGTFLSGLGYSRRPP